MPLNEKEVTQKIEELKKQEDKKRKFTQTIDLIVNLKEIDLKQPANRINTELMLPNPLGKDIKICVIAQGDLALRATKVGVPRVIEKDELGGLGGDKKIAKKIAKTYDYFIVGRDMMPLVARFLGPVLGPSGKMPLAPPKGNGIVNVQDNIEEIIEGFKNTVRLRIKKNPIILCPVGKEDMDPENIAKNISTIFNYLEEHLVKGRGNIRNLFVKKSMGKPIKIEI
ncbi:MAG: 50S ribosomal protein L1 [Candidatus Lokiarchaeota archaeon]|nr:50S ribosomal protein L1 [Candidatus Lokiarchaeota archaeon]